MKIPYIPNELLNIIFEYDGRIKYEKGKFINIIHKHDNRYNILKPLISKKLKILKKIYAREDGGFYFEFGFDICNSVGLCYDYGFNESGVLEICYYDVRDVLIQIRTYL